MPICRAELRKMLMELVDPAGSSIDLDRLVELLRDDMAARRYYRQFMDVHARLELLHDTPLPMPVFEIPESSSQAQIRKPVDHTQDVPERRDLPIDVDWMPATKRSRLPRMTFSRAAAVGVSCALLTLALATWFTSRAINQPGETTQIKSEAGPRQTTPAKIVAQVTRLANCEWRSDLLTSNAYLTPGAVVDLASGSAEIKMACGVFVAIKGPATFRIETAASGYLQQGRISCRVPDGIDGFTVLTPSATVVDFGTEFGVWVNDDGVTEAHVFSGMVGLQPSSLDPADEVGDVRFISTAEGARLERKPYAQVERIDYQSDAFPTLVPAEYPIGAHPSGGLLRSNASGVLFGSHLQSGTRRIGSSLLHGMGLANVFLFRLPPLETSSHIESARLEWTYKAKEGSPEFSVDVYGLGYMRTAPHEENWFHEGGIDSSSRSVYQTGSGDRRVVLLAQELLQPQTQPGRIVLENTEISKFVQSLYDDGAQGGEMAVFRLNADTSTVTITRKTGYCVVHAPAIFGKATSEELPTLHLRVLQSPNVGESAASRKFVPLAKD